MSEEPGFLSAARYGESPQSDVLDSCADQIGKDLVRVCRVVRDGEKHHVAEYTVRGR